MFNLHPNFLVILATYLGITTSGQIPLNDLIVPQQSEKNKLEEIFDYTQETVNLLVAESKRIERLSEEITKEENKTQKELSILEEKIEQVFILSGMDEEIPSHQPKTAIRNQEQVFLYPVIAIKEGKQTEYYSCTPEIKLKGKKIKTNPNKKTREQLENVLLRWSKVEPIIDFHHPYENSNPDTKKWKGFDKIRYSTTLFSETKGLQKILADVNATKRMISVGLGTMRFSLELNINQSSWNTPNHESVSRGGIKSDVLRVSYLLDKTLLGWTTSYFNVPGIYGSASLNHRRSQQTHQTELYIGFDCADLVVGAARHLNKRYQYTNANGLKDQTKFSEEYLLHQDGKITDLQGKEVKLEYGKDVKEGDLVFYADQGRNNYWHVVVLLRDQNLLLNKEGNEENKENQQQVENSIELSQLLGEEVSIFTRPKPQIFSGHDWMLHYDDFGLGLNRLTDVSYKTQKIVFGRIKH